jgi:hypothetical protein
LEYSEIKVGGFELDDGKRKSLSLTYEAQHDRIISDDNGRYFEGKLIQVAEKYSILIDGVNRNKISIGQNMTLRCIESIQTHLVNKNVYAVVFDHIGNKKLYDLLRRYFVKNEMSTELISSIKNHPLVRSLSKSELSNIKILDLESGEHSGYFKIIGLSDEGLKSVEFLANDLTYSFYQWFGRREP